MKAVLPFLCALVTFLSIASAAKVVAVPFSRVPGSKPPSQHVVKRGTVQGNAINALQLITYYTNVTVGTPPQSVGLVIDTGSSDTWVPSTNSKETCDVSVLGCPYGTFDETRSSTYRNIGHVFSSTYGIIQKFLGTYMTDTLTINGVSIEHLNMALVTNASLPPEKDLIFEEPTLGIMGLGFNAAQVNYTHCPPTPATRNCTLNPLECHNLQVAPCLKPSLLDRLVEQKAINSRAFSLYLENLEAKEGTILFGGIDTSKFIPPLLPVDILSPGLQYMIQLTSISLGGGQNDSHQQPPKPFDIPKPLPVLLDSGAEAIYLPPPLASAIQTSSGARTVPQYHYPIIDCAQSSNTTSLLHFGFGSDPSGTGGPIITVPKNQLIIPRFDAQTGKQLMYEGKEVCEFGVWSSESKTGSYTVGDTLLRSAYVVYDADRYTVSLAQARFGDDAKGEGGVVEIEGGGGLRARRRGKWGRGR